MTAPINFKRLLAALALIPLFLTAIAIAQPAPMTRPAPGQGQGQGGPGIFLQRMQETINSLGLSDEQKTRIQAITKKTQDEWQSMRNDLQSMDPQDRIQHIRDLLDGARRDISDVLNPEQREKFEKAVEEARQNFRNRFGQNAGTTRPALAGATTRPNGLGRPGETAAGQGGFDRLRQNLEQLGLSDDQKQKIRDLFQEVQTKGQSLRMQAESGVASARGELRQLFQDTRQKLGDILTPEQRNKLRELMTRQGGSGDGNRRPPSPAQTNAKTAADKNEMMMQSGGPAADSDNMMTAGAAGSKSSTARKTDTVALTPTSSGPNPGDAAPALTLKKLEGGNLDLSSLKGRVVVLEFGSYSCPAFRNRVASMEKLKNEYGTRVSFYVVYAREAHALGEWEVDRNKDDGISVEQPKSLEQRRALAEEARDKLKITVPIVMDSLGNDAAAQLGAGANSAYVITRDGTILARQKWFEPIALRRVLDEATKPPTEAARSATTKPAA